MYDPAIVVYDSLMKQYRMQKEFLSRIGSFEPFKLLFDLLPNVAFYIKDLSGRIMVINRRNCMNCNIPNELSAIGKTSYDLFPSSLADEYFRTDMAVIKTGKPLLNRVYHSPDYSTKPIIANKVPVYDKNHRIMGVAMMYYFGDMASDPSGWNKHLADVVDYIHRNYAQQIKSEKLAQIAGVSESHLKRIFRRLFVMSPIGYVILTRINASRDLLETTTRTVSDIAQEVGFYDHSHFIRHFRRIRGCTPNQYRKQHMHMEMSGKENKSRRRPVRHAA